MVTVRLKDSRNAVHTMEDIISFDICHTMGEPCDYYEITSLYSEAIAQALPDTARVEIRSGSSTVFVGVLDEYIITVSEKGTLITINGRSLAALLLDSESEAKDYASADLGTILNTHVTPCGISNIIKGTMPSVTNFSVSSGTSQWNVLKRFCRASTGVQPRFNRSGSLVLNDSGGYNVGNMPPVYSAKLKDTRYGIVASVLVKNRVTGASYTLKNNTLVGGTCKRVLSVPKNTGSAAMRSTASYLIEESKKDKSYIEVTIDRLFSMFPGDTVTINVAALGLSGAHRVIRTRCWANDSGSGSVIRLEV